jgi:hypothetical protein
MRKVLIPLLGLAVLLILAGVSLLLGRPSSPLLLPTADSEASVAYSSELVVAFDGAKSPAGTLTLVGGVLVLGGLTISAAAFGRRLGRESSDAR